MITWMSPDPKWKLGIVLVFSIDHNIVFSNPILLSDLTYLGNQTYSNHMRVVYHSDFENSDYAHNPAASEGRIEAILREMEDLPDIEFVEPSTATMDDLRLVHTEQHIEKVKRNDLLFHMASLAAGTSIKAAETSYRGEPAFGLVRPPGHHASPGSAWGFCYFNNMAIAIKRLMSDGKIRSAFILDFDLHTGDGNINSLSGEPTAEMLNPVSEDRKSYLQEVRESLKKAQGCDIIGVSAGFDEHVDDWGGKLTTSDYQELGIMVKEFSIEKCKGRRFALLEGGYNHSVLGKNVASFLEGFSGGE